MPIAHGSGNEHIVFTAEFDNCRIGSRAVGYVAMRIVDHVGIIKIKRITIRVGAHTLAMDSDRQKEEQQENANQP